MASETFKKRQKERARQEKRQKNANRLRERRDEKAKAGSKFENEKPAEPVSRLQSTALAKVGNPKYFSCSIRPRDPKKKSQITLHATRKVENTSGHSV
jgi:hypothetical protein